MAKWEQRWRCSYLHIEAKVLLLFEKEIKDKLPHEVRIQRIIDHFSPTKLAEKREKESQQHVDQYGLFNVFALLPVFS